MSGVKPKQVNRFSQNSYCSHCSQRRKIRQQKLTFLENLQQSPNRSHVFRHGQSSETWTVSDNENKNHLV